MTVKITFDIEIDASNETDVIDRTNEIEAQLIDLGIITHNNNLDADWDEEDYEPYTYERVYDREDELY